MKSPFIIRSANEWLEEAAKAPAPVSLYKNLWHEGELACLVGNAASDRSSVALGIADRVAKSRKVLLVDFSRTLRRFAEASSGRFADNLMRLQPDRRALEETSPEELMEQIENCLRDNGIKVCVIDSLTWLCDYFRKADAARWFLRAVCSMRRRLGLSVLFVTTAPRRMKEGADASAFLPRRCEPFVDTAFSTFDCEEPKEETDSTKPAAKAPQSTAKTSKVQVFRNHPGAPPVIFYDPADGFPAREIEEAIESTACRSGE